MGPSRGTNLRNIAIVLALAVLVWKLPGGGTASLTISNLLGIIFIGGLLFFGYRIYMENRETIFGLEERQRGLLYAGLALIVITLVATRRMWDASPLGAVVWLALMSGGVYAIYSVWRAYRTY